MQRWLAKSIPFLVISISLFFTIQFGMEAIRILSSPVYGLELTRVAQIVHGIGGRLGLGAAGLLRLALLFGSLNLAVATLFAVYLVSRIRSLAGENAHHEIMDAAVLLLALTTIIAATPAVLDGKMHLLDEYRQPLWLGGLIVTLNMIERFMVDENQPERMAWEWRQLTVHEVLLPPKRNGANTLRWDALRRTANVAPRPTGVRLQRPIPIRLLRR